MLKSTKSTKKL